ncbi:Glycosyltransferase 28 domain protein [Geobacter metallireducens RCH3]|uniref:Glycosyltransferase n=1 Tax=Geobacter metallireducens (strain ATCC 53774 / DSM 7210 / GS-15) TaxID=269799 RepID=Q39U04_GEOMG|nr:nucleotide disphospho-sugar-binding domain-containing protein [Geobacter metallireducens]ABB32270.1 glycosyltransferase [Geobacter metallireducens GS-15]EHP86963.1 Glycosyltransferase 28 domain protein [Geobacter metallireducens RCH3]
MRILAFPYTHTLSHLSRVLAVALELRRMGHEVVFAGESAKVSFVSQQGFDVVPIHEPDPEMLFGNIRSGKLRFVEDAELLQMLTADIEVIRSLKPDLVLSDGRFSAPLSTHLTNVRHAAIVNASSTEYRALPYVPFFDWMPPWLISRDAMIWKALVRLNLFLEMKLFDNVMKVFKRLSRELNTNRTVTATNCLTGKDITLLADIPEYFPSRNLPASYHYVGPLTWKSVLAPPAWWPLDIPSSPLVYVTMGTTGVSEFFSKLGPSLSTSFFSSIVTTGGQSSELKPMPGKVYVESYLDGDLVMERSDVVICHGGNGTIYQALSHGKPVIGIPTIPDQKFNMRRVEAMGFGKSLDLKQFLEKPSLLADTVKQVLSDHSFRNSAQKIQAVLKSYNAATTSAKILIDSIL